jgi:hypothetical protein
VSDPWQVGDSMISETDMGPWFGDDPDPTGDAEFTAWLQGLPDDIRADYLSRPWGGPLESDPAGFWHHDADAAVGGIGFSAGGAHDTLPPGPYLAWLAAATDAGRAELGESELIGVLCAWQRLTSWAQAGQTATLMTLVRRRETQARELDRPSLAEHASDEVAAALRLTGRSANQLLFTAGGLDRLPDVLALLQRGEIDWVKACLFVDQLTGLSDDDAREIAAALLGRAGGMTSGQLRAALTQAVLAHDPEAAERRRKDARADSGVHTWTETSGNAALAGRELAAADVIHASVRLTAFARSVRKRGATGTMDQLRAAVYIALLTGRAVETLLPLGRYATASCPDAADPRSAAPDTSGRATAGPDIAGPDTAGPAWSADSTPTDGPEPRAAAASGWPQLTGTVNLTMPMSTWLGLTRSPGEVTSHGPIDAETCCHIAEAMDSASRWCLTLTDPAGQAVAHACSRHRPPHTGSPRTGPPHTGPPLADDLTGSLTWAAGLATRLQHFETAPCGHIRQSVGYKPSQSLRHVVVIRQRRCSFPGCRRPAARSDLDHTTPFDQGGLTCECNLAPLCRRHHQAKQAPGWELTQPKPGQMTWRTPNGRGYQTTGDPY